MNYKLEGNGKTLVFIHGLSDNLLYWEVLASNLKHNYQVLRIDLRGHGLSDLGDDDISIDVFTDDLHCLLAELDIDDVNLIGFSLGGAVAVDFTIKYPQMVSSLVLMSSFYRVDEHLENIFQHFKKALQNSFYEFYDLILPMVLCPAVIEDNKDELETLRKISSQSADTNAYIQAIDACLDFDAESDISQIKVPTLILAGKYDEITSLESQKQLQSSIDKSKMIVFDDVKHNLLVGKNNGRILNILTNEM